MPSFHILRFFKKNPDNYVMTDCKSERSFDGKLDLARSKDDSLRGMRRCCLFKVPSTYASAAMVQRLAGTSRVLRLSSDLFSKAFKWPPRLWSENNFHNKNTQVPSRTPQVLGGYE
jgi:hypothetical protein